jgi:polyferredoxin
MSLTARQILQERTRVMRLLFFAIAIMLLVTPFSIGFFGVPLGIMIGVVSPIFVIPVAIFLMLAWGGRNGRNVWR